MAKLHELLAAEKTPTAAWNQLREETLKKFGNPSHFFDGHSRALTMIEDTPQNEAIEAQAREEKPVVTTVYDTLSYALDVFAKAENLQYQKNATNREASADVLWRGEVLLKDMPVDELLGLEARLVKIRELIAAVPTLDASKHWRPAPNIGERVWETRFPTEATKTEKRMFPVVMSPATDKHPAQVQAVQKDEVVGKFTTTFRSGAATALQKATAIQVIDELAVEVKQARMRANETRAVQGVIAELITALILAPFARSEEDHA